MSNYIGRLNFRNFVVFEHRFHLKFGFTETQVDFITGKIRSFELNDSFPLKIAHLAQIRFVYLFNEIARICQGERKKSVRNP